MEKSSFRRLTGLACLAFVASVCGCSSDGAVQIIPAAAGKTGAAGAAGRAAGGASSGGMAGTSSGGKSGADSGAGGEGGDGLTPVELPWLHTEGNKIMDAHGNTVVLRGVAMIDLPFTDQYEGGINKMIDRLTSADDAQGSSPGWSTKVLRMAVTPGYKMDQGSPARYLPDSNYYEHYLRPAVDYAKSKGVYAIIDWHDIDDSSLHVEDTSAFWTDIAPRFANDSNVLFELYNEPKESTWSTVKTNMQTWIDIVRQSAPDNLILVGTPQWCQLVGDASSDPVQATNIAYIAHMYPQHWSFPSLHDQITKAAGTVPVFITEWGFHEAPMDDLLNGSITSYGTPFKAFIDGLNLSWTAWCASKSWAPQMFDMTYALKVGETQMGGFAKDWLYEKKDDGNPQP